MKCKVCGAEFDGGSYCPNCGSNNKAYVPPKEEEPKPKEEPVFEEEPEVIVNTHKSSRHANPEWPRKSKVGAAILALLLGGIGAQRFYLNTPGVGILCILFAWTGIPALVGFIEGLIILVENDRDFEERYKVTNSD